MTCLPTSPPLRILVSVLTGVVAAAVMGVTSATASTPPATTCRPWQAFHVTGTNGQPYVIRNKPSINHNDHGMCVSDPGRRAGFRVTRSPGWAQSAKVRAYPYIGTGCFEGACAGGRGVMRAAALGNYTVSWSTVTPRRSGVYNSSLDLWLGAHTGLGSSEVMIWLRYSKPAWWTKRYPTVRIDGAKWYVVTKPTVGGLHYISFRRATPANSARLRLAPFITAARRARAVTASSMLWSVQAGFEIWSGGQGLAVTHFSTSG